MKKKERTIARTGLLKSARVAILSLFILISSGFLGVKTLLNPILMPPMLAVPNVSKVYLPDPLSITPFFANVLGAQVFNPADVVRFVNAEREKTGAKPLRLNYTLMRAAQMRADVILRHQNFSHQDPYENVELALVLPKLGYSYIYASENIGMGGSSGEDFVNGFMHSTSHRENLLNPRLTETGVGLVTGPYKQYYVNIIVQLFAIPAGQSEYLGYTKADRNLYNLLYIRTNLEENPLVWNINRFIGERFYSEERFVKLKRQKEILATLIAKMDREEPLNDADVALIVEYNSDNT